MADEAEDHHHDMLGNADRVAEGDLGHRDAGLDRRVEIDMVGTDTSSERELELGRLGDALGRQIGGPEGLRSEEHTSELQSLMRISYAVFCLNKKQQRNKSCILTK